MMDKAILSEFKFFSGVDSDKLSAIAEKCDVAEFKADDLIFQRDESADTLYGVLDGEVELSLIFRDKILKTDIQYEESILARIEIMEKPIAVDKIGPGEILGWSALVSPRQWSANARCATPAKIFSLPAADFKSMLDQDPSMGYLIMERVSEIISQRLENRTDKLIETWGETFEVDKI